MLARTDGDGDTLTVRDNLAEKYGIVGSRFQTLDEILGRRRGRLRVVWSLGHC